MTYFAQELCLIMTPPAKVNSLSEQIPGKLFLHPCLVCRGMTGNTANRMIIFPCYFVLMAFQAVRELLGKRDVNGEKDNEHGREKNRK